MTSGRCSINLDTSIIVNKVEFNDFITIIRKEKALKWPPTYSYIPCRVIIRTQIKRSFIESILVASGLGSWSRIRLWDGRRKGIWGNRENIGVFMKIRRNQTFTAAWKMNNKHCSRRKASRKLQIVGWVILHGLTRKSGSVSELNEVERKMAHKNGSSHNVSRDVVVCDNGTGVRK